MRAGAIETFCLALPGATLTVQKGWGGERVYKVGGKMFAALSPKGARPQKLSFKAAPDSFAILTQTAHIIPAPYAAHLHWVMLEKLDALPAKELKAYLARAHALVAARLPKKTRKALGLEG